MTVIQLYLGPAGDGVVRMVMESGAFVKAILVILLAFSVSAWAIIIHKARLFRRVQEANARFLRLFRAGDRVRDTVDRCVALPGSPLAGILKAGWRQVQAHRENPGGTGGADALRRDLAAALEVQTTEEISRLRRYLVFLAVTSSVCPFFGLLGTVWGVMDAFLSIGIYGSANIQVVAPGIAEALITTVAGLAAAIPAVIAYNYFVSRLRRVIEVIDAFSVELTSAIVREEA
jgi:biopolymer transport protein TolQ